MATKTAYTHCRICEPQCGLVATISDGRLVSVRGDADHVHSQGYVCTKAAGAVEIVYDPDRVTQPMKRVGDPGVFEPVSWDEALDDIAQRLGRIRTDSSPDALATFCGNPPLFSFATSMALAGFQEVLGIRWRYGINSEDASARMAANALLYGSVAIAPKPDLWRTHFAVIIGANPLVSHGSLVTEARLREALDAVIERGGRVVVVDPRRTETAQRYEHISVRPGSDAFLLLGIIRTLIDKDLVNHSFIDRHVGGLSTLADVIAPFDIQRCASRSGIPAAVIEQLARDFASADSGVVYGRTGTCTQRFGTLNNVLQDIVVLLTGNFDRAGGLLFGWAAIDLPELARKAGTDTYGKVRTRVNQHPDVFGLLPSTDLAVDIVTPGEGQIKALALVGGNPVLSSAGGGTWLEEALEQLELSFSLDLYINETNKHCHYVLPVTHFYERDDVPVTTLANMLRPAIWATEAVIEPPAGVRQEWQILNEIAKRMGRGGAHVLRPLRWLAKLGWNITPRRLLDLLLRTGKAGDRFGLRRRGVSFDKLTRDFPHGKKLLDELPTGEIDARLATPDGKIPLAAPEVLGELAALGEHTDDDRFGFRLIGMRELRSHNTWMHNAPRLMPEGRCLTARVNPSDAHRLGLAGGSDVDITSASGTVRVSVAVSDEVGPGTVALPHGWGHDGGWRRANAAGGVNSNILASASGQDIERLAGMSILNGIPVNLSAVADDPQPACERP